MALEGLSLAEQLHLAELYGIETEYVPGQDDEGLPEDYFDNLNAAESVLNQAPTSVTQPITTVEPTETGGGIFGEAGKVGGVLDTLIGFHPAIGGPYSAFRNAQALFDEELRDGTAVGWFLNQMESPNSWWGGLVGEPTGQGLFGESTEMGSFGTAEGLGGVSNSIEDDMAVSDY